MVAVHNFLVELISPGPLQLSLVCSISTLSFNFNHAYKNLQNCGIAISVDLQIVLCVRGVSALQSSSFVAVTYPVQGHDAAQMIIINRAVARNFS
jgi:hypothetical protein